MANQRQSGWWGRRIVGPALFLGVLTAGVIYAGLSLHQELGSLRSASQDNVEWSISQLDVDVLHLNLALQSAETEARNLDEVRKRFDIFYSRVQTIRRGDGFASLRAVPEIAAGLTELNRFLEQTVSIIDLPDQVLATQLPLITAQLATVRQDARSLSTNGVRVFAETNVRQREKFVDALTVSSLFALALILLLGVSLVVLDYQRRLAQERTRERERSRKRLIATNDAALEGIIVADHEGRITDWNPGAARMFGFSAEEAVGREMSELIIPEKFRDAHIAGMKRFLATGQKRVIDAGRVELSALRSDGNEFPVELAIAATEDDDGPIFISYMRDISARIKSQQELTEARDAALAADRVKSRFLAVMSHEMRTPLNGILGVMDLMKRTDLTTDQRRYVETTDLSGKVLLRHLNDVLDISRIEAGRLNLETVPVDLREIVDQVLEIGRPLSEANCNVIETKIDPDVRPVLGDPHRLRQALLNMVGNAAKFTDHGKIRVSVDVLDSTVDRMTVEVSVFNTGVPIPIEDRTRIFEDFVTLDDSYNRSNTGSGLGLAISKKVIESMSGSIGLKDDVVDGNHFWFSVPFELVDDVKPVSKDRDTEMTQIAPKRVLLVEDNDLNREIVRTMLTDSGHEIVEAIDGAEAIKTANEEYFDAILMDVSMPNVTGLEATLSIRSAPGPCQHTPIIGLTAHALPEELQRFIDVGMQVCLTKPVRRNTLLQTIDAQTSGSPGIDGPSEQIAEELTLIDEDVFSDLVLSLPSETVQETLHRVISEINTGVKTAQKMMSDQDLISLKSHSHHLASTAAIVGASRLQSQLSDVESACSTGQEQDLVRLIKDLDPIADQTTAALLEFADQ